MRSFAHRLRHPGLDPVRLDYLLATVLTADAVLDAWLGGDSAAHRVPDAVVGAMVTATVAIRRRYPALVGTLVPVFSSVNFAIWGGPQALAYPIAHLCALYALAVWTPPRRFAVGITVASAAYLATALAPGGDVRVAVQFTVAADVGTLLVRTVVGDRERRARVAERERDVAAREAVVEERNRIARELHDVIAHHVSMIVLQAGAERRRVGDADNLTHEALQTIEQSGRGALTEMRRLLGMLREDAGEPLAPQPGIGDVPQLVEQLGEAGLPVVLEIEGEPTELPIGVELSAYRIVQEALTNALKHAGDAHASVRIRYAPDCLELEIADDGTGAASAPASGGHGLVGMRERVALYGGRLDAGLRPTGGFVVNVSLPIR